jgi:hypothetical protein
MLGLNSAVIRREENVQKAARADAQPRPRYWFQVHFYKVGGINQTLPAGVWNRFHN